jgi:hypothetical protein
MVDEVILYLTYPETFCRPDYWRSLSIDSTHTGHPKPGYGISSGRLIGALLDPRVPFFGFSVLRLASCYFRKTIRTSWYPMGFGPIYTISGYNLPLSLSCHTKYTLHQPYALE